MITYRIKDWADLYENNRTREMVQMQWLPLPNRHDSDGYTTLLERENGAALYGAWVAILQVASRCTPRGSLVRDGDRPHDAQSLARMTRIPVALIKETLILCLEECKWLEISGCDDGGGVPAPSPRFSAPIPHPTDEEWKGRNGRNGREPAASPPQEPARKAKATSEEISAFCAVEGITPPDATWFFNKCEGNGWTNAGKAIKDWRATLRAWKAAGYLPTQKPGYKAPTGGLTETIIPNIITCED